MILVRQKIMDNIAVQSSVASGVAYSDTIQMEHCTGDVAFLVTSTTNSTLAIIQECSDDGVNFYVPVTGAMAAMGAIASSTTAPISAWTVPTLAPCKYMRAKVTNSTDLAAICNITMYMTESQDS